MAGMEEFVASPLDGFLDCCTKVLLLIFTDNYELDLTGLGDNCHKENTNSESNLQLTEIGELVAVQIRADHTSILSRVVTPGNLAFEQQNQNHQSQNNLLTPKEIM